MLIAISEIHPVHRLFRQASNGPPAGQVFRPKQTHRQDTMFCLRKPYMQAANRLL